MSFMEHLKRTGKQFRPTRFAVAVLVMAATLVSVSCGPQVIKGRPPFISISGMNLDGDSLSTEFNISNQNGVTMTIESVEITVNVNTTELARYTGQEQLEISANTTEKVVVQATPDDFTKNLLTSLDDGRLQSLAFDLQGSVMTLENDRLRSEHTGYLYPVPGKPGYYRAAVTQAKGLVRDDL